MKKLIILFLISASSIFAQSWNPVVPTLIPFNFQSKIDQFSNKDGINVLLDYYDRNWPNNEIKYLKYYLLNSSGSIIREFQLENQDVQFACIDGNNDKIYVVYKLGNQIKTRKSVNAGQSWTNLADINVGNNICNNVDIYFGKDDNALHIVWATQDAGSDYKTYYRRLYNDVWSTTEYVTDGGLVGGFPTVSKSTNRVHVSFNTGQSSDPQQNVGIAKSRDKYINTWQTSQTIFDQGSFRERIHAGASKLFDFYYKFEGGLGQYTSILYVKNRDFTSSTWSTPFQLDYGADVIDIVSAVNTTDSKTHIVYSNGYYRNNNGTTWSEEYTLGEDGLYAPTITATSNDLFVVSGGYTSNNVYYLHYDATPLAPQNLTVVESTTDHPILIWSKNNEADLNEYIIDRAEWGVWTNDIARTSSNSYSDLEVFLNPIFLDEVSYRVRAVDKTNHISLPSNVVTIENAVIKKKRNETSNVDQYELSDAYPNPFNPSTKISYSIKEEGLVTLKIYDILGKEIATLVNENKPAGIYEVEFNASALPSGMYIYKIQSGSFTDVKKMLLTK